MAWTLANFLGVLVVAPFNRRAASRWFGGAWGRGLLRAVPVRVRIHGRDNIDPDKPYVVVINHLSLIDIPLLYGWLPLDLTWIMKKEVAKIPVIATGAALLGHVLIDRSDHQQAVRTLLRLEEALRPGTSLLFFAEGTRSRSGRLQPFKMGAFHMAHDLSLSILPVTIIGTGRVLSADTMQLHPGEVDLVIHPAIGRADVEASTPEALRDRCRAIIAGAL